ncbi:hypothetical protein [Streptomyces sp. NPDC095613]|uniref:hypothetical protein n=1 Tax=Streptomyces sp. NPDC095613 TaxID=3155540 RepID=UPI00331A3AC3
MTGQAMSKRDGAAEHKQPQWFTGGPVLHRFLLEMTASEGALRAMATASSPPSEKDSETMLDFLSDQLVSVGYTGDWEEPNEKGRKIEALIDVFNDLIPED